MSNYLAEVDGVLYEYTRPDLLLISIAEMRRKPDRIWKGEAFGTGRMRYVQVSDAAVREDSNRMQERQAADAG